VNFKAYPQEIYDISQAKDVEVVMYLFEGTVRLLFLTGKDEAERV